MTEQHPPRDPTGQPPQGDETWYGVEPQPPEAQPPESQPPESPESAEPVQGSVGPQAGSYDPYTHPQDPYGQGGYPGSPAGPGYAGYGHGGWGPEHALPPPPMPARRGYPIVAWLVILAVVAAIIVTGQLASDHPQPAKPGEQSIDLFIMNMQSQYLVGAFDIIPDTSGAALSQADAMLNMGSLKQRIGFVILSAELGTPDDADAYLRDVIEKLEAHDYEFEEGERELLEIVKHIYLLPQDELIDSVNDGGGTAVRTKLKAPLSADQQDVLEQELGWLGKLAVTHAQPDEVALRASVMQKATRVATAFLGFLGGISVVGFGGFIGLVVMAVLVAVGRIPVNLQWSVPDGGIYAETFAVWIVAFLGLQIIGSVLMAGASELLIALLAFFLSLGALLWPVVRGIPWSEVRRDIGWTSGQGIAVEVAAGLVSYAMAIPLVAIGLLGTLLLMGISGGMAPAGPEANPFTPSGVPAHPIIIDTAGAGIWPKVLLLLVAAVAAPIVEETMFRGVLYRSMRNATSRWTRFGSVLVSILVVSFIFAAIHPQGLFAVPVLMALAAAMNLAREWRDSIIAPMVVHGTSNGIVMTLLIVIAA